MMIAFMLGNQHRRFSFCGKQMETVAVANIDSKQLKTDLWKKMGDSSGIPSFR